MRLKRKHFAVCLSSLAILVTISSFHFVAKAQESSTTTTTSMTAHDHYNRAKQLDGQGKHHEAVAEYTKAIHLDPNFGEAYFFRGNSYSLLSTPDYEKAKADLEKAKSIYSARGISKAVEIIEQHKQIIEAGIQEDQLVP